MAGQFQWGGRSWGPGEKDAFAAWLRKHGSTYSGWASNHQGAASTLTTDPVQAAALQQATALEQPNIDAILAEQKKARDQAALDVQNAQGFAQALASMYGSIAPAVSGIYTGAAGETGQLAKGFADATTAQQAAETSGANAILAKAGAPAAAVAGADAKIGGPVGDVLYGTAGFLPAAGLAREGAAFGSAAAQLPAVAGGLGQQNAAAIRHDAALQDQSYLDALRQERDKIPGSALDILQQQRQFQLSQQANQIQADYLGNTTRNTTASLTGIDPVTGKPTYKVLSDAAKLAAAKAAGYKPNAALSAKYGHIVDSYGNAIPDSNGNWIPVAKTGSPKANPAIVAHQKGVKARETAFAQARTGIANDVPGMINTHQMTRDEQFAFRQTHHRPPTQEEMTVHQVPGYVQAKQILFNKYKSVLRYATRSGRPVLRKRLNTIIDEILASYGIHPAGPPRTGSTSGADTPGPHNTP